MPRLSHTHAHEHAAENVLLRPWRRGRLALLAGLVACPSEPGFTLPDVRAESRYIQYSDWGEAPLCDSLLDELDGYVEDLAEFLQVAPPPPLSIRYTWVHPDAGVEVPLPCPGGTGGCAEVEGDSVQIFAKVPANSHELVHAVHLLTLPRSDAILHEGLANYLGTSIALEPYDPGDFAREFQALLAQPRPNTHEEYQVAMHYVGSVAELYGVDAFKRLWHALPPDSTAEEFAAAHLEIFGEPLADTLLKLEQYAPAPWERAPRTACDGPEVEWWDRGSRTLDSDSACLGQFDVYEPVPDELLYVRRFRTELPQAGSWYLQRQNPIWGTTVYLRRCDPGSLDPGVWINEDGTVAELSAGSYVFETVAHQGDEVMIPIEISISPIPMQ